MENLQQRTLDRLNNRLAQLINQPNVKETDIDVLVSKIKQAEQDKKSKEIEQKLNSFNKENKRKRDILKRLIDLKMPSVDITNNDRTLHATKAKKVDGLEQLNKDAWCLRFDFENGKYILAEESGNRYQLVKIEYKYGEDDKYTEFESFEAACKQNGIQYKDLKLKDVLKRIAKIEREGEKVKAAIKKYEDAIEKQKVHTLSYAGLVRQQNERLYTYHK